MTKAIKNETKRGYQEASQQFALLRTTWPLAFPEKPHRVRPLASGGAAIVAEAFGWSIPYARAVLKVWKLRDTYCRAVLAHSQRINLDGSASAEEIDDEARQKAKEQLERIAARKAKKSAQVQRIRRVGLTVDRPEEWIEAVRTAQGSTRDSS